MKLYELAKEFNELLQLCESGDIAALDIVDTIEAMTLAFEDKVKNCLMIVKQLEGNSAVIDSEIDRLKLLKAANDTSSESLKDYIKVNMEAIGKDKLDLGVFKVTLRAPSKVVNVLDESKIPGEYWKIIPESKQLDKRALSDSLKAGAVDGAELIDGKRSLLIK